MGLPKRRQARSGAIRRSFPLVFCVVLGLEIPACLGSGSLDTDVHLAAGNQPSTPTKLASILLRLSQAQDAEIFARVHNIELVDRNVRVVIRLDSTTQADEMARLASTYGLFVEKRANSLLRALVPIHQLVPLSGEPKVRFVDVPTTPKAQPTP